MAVTYVRAGVAVEGLHNPVQQVHVKVTVKVENILRGKRGPWEEYQFTIALDRVTHESQVSRREVLAADVPSLQGSSAEGGSSE